MPQPPHGPKYCPACREYDAIRNPAKRTKE